MKNTKKFAAMMAALTLTACSVAPMFSFAEGEKTTNTVTINLPVNDMKEVLENYGVEHTYRIYQIFSGTYKAATNDAAESLEGLTWGTGVSDKSGVVDPQDEAFVALTANSGNDRADIKAFKKLITLSNTYKEVTTSGATASVAGLEDGYYYIEDVTDLADGTGTVEGENKDKYDANSAIMVQIIGGTSTAVTVKKARPSVEKKIWDETEDAEVNAENGWGETADHAINESFDFKLTATIPADSDLQAYDTYYLQFKDSFSDGVSFEDIKTLKIDGNTIIDRTDDDKTNDSDEDHWTITPVTKDTNTGISSFTVTTQDIKSQVSADKWGVAEITVEVIYSAHLNEGAKFFSSGTGADGSSDVENNYVSLKYSNNPDETGAGEDNTGETPKDYVWAFTYRVDNTKVDATDNTKKLKGAEFKLYKDLVKDENEIKVKKVTRTITPADEASGTEAVTEDVYVLAKEGETGDTITSLEDVGTFNIIGLDAGKYILKETKEPDGYAKVTDDSITEFTISATHSETSDGEKAVLVFLTPDTSEGAAPGATLDSTPVNQVKNSFSSALPSTGGIGTTIFYLGGGAMVAVAGVFLITKKRMGRSEN